jgi:hypothetical protein
MSKRIYLGPHDAGNTHKLRNEVIKNLAFVVVHDDPLKPAAKITNALLDDNGPVGTTAQDVTSKGVSACATSMRRNRENGAIKNFFVS